MPIRPFSGFGKVSPAALVTIAGNDAIEGRLEEAMQLLREGFGKGYYISFTSKDQVDPSGKISAPILASNKSPPQASRSCVKSGGRRWRSAYFESDYRQLPLIPTLRSRSFRAQRNRVGGAFNAAPSID